MPVLPADIYVGEDVACLVSATDPTNNNAPITDLDCDVEFFDPSKSPKTTPADRASPDHTAELTYDSGRAGYYGLVSTAGWVDGTWSFRIVLTGSRVNWSFGTFRIKP